MVWRARASILTKASSWRHERANFRPDVFFSNTRVRRIFILIFICGEQRTKAPSSLHRIIDYQRSVFLLAFVLPLPKRFPIIKWKNHEIYEIHSSARINNRPWNRCSSRRRELRGILFNLCQNIKDDTWDVMRDDRQRVGGERRDSNQSSCAINNFGAFCGGASDEITGSYFTLN